MENAIWSWFCVFEAGFYRQFEPEAQEPFLTSFLGICMYLWLSRITLRLARRCHLHLKNSISLTRNRRFWKSWFWTSGFWAAQSSHLFRPIHFH